MAYPDTEHAAHFLGNALADDTDFVDKLGAANIFFGAVPNIAASQFPCFNGRWLEGSDVNGFNHQNRLLTRLRLLAVIVALDAVSDSVAAAAGLMDDVFVAQFRVSHSYAGETRAYNVWREQPFATRYEEGPAGQKYYEMGGIYVVEIVA